MAGYHLREIEKHPYGTLGKITEEVEELVDAEQQGIRIMVLCELSDIVGAIEGYLESQFPGVTLEDLVDMAHVTARAFQEGRR
jgi:hypothetical protein